MHYTTTGTAPPQPPSRSYHLMTVEWLSDDDGLVPLAIVGEADEIS